jgi:hypothetical protein
VQNFPPAQLLAGNCTSCQIAWVWATNRFSMW